MEDKVYIDARGQEWLESELILKADENGISFAQFLSSNPGLKIKEVKIDPNLYVDGRGQEWSKNELTSKAKNNNISFEDFLKYNPNLKVKGSKPKVKEVEVIDVEDYKITDSEVKLEEDFIALDNKGVTLSGGSIGDIEDGMVPFLSDKFSKWGFRFEDSGWGDYVTVSIASNDINKVGLSKEFSVGNSGKIDKKGLAEMKAWMQEHKQDGVVEYIGDTPELSVEDLRNMPTSDPNMSYAELQKEADKNKVLQNFKKKVYASHGLDWNEVEKMRNINKHLDGEINFLKTYFGTMLNVQGEEIVGGGFGADIVKDAYGFVNPATGEAYGLASMEELSPFVKEARKKYPHLFNKDGNLKNASYNYLQKIEEKSNEYGKILQGSGSSIGEIERESDKLISEAVFKVRDEVILENENITKVASNLRENELPAATGGLELDAYMDIYNSKQENINQRLKSVTGGIGFDDINSYKPKTQEEADKVNSLIRESQTLYENEGAEVNDILGRMQALSNKQAALNQKANDTRLLMNFGDIENIRGEYIEGTFNNIYNSTMQGWSQGTVNAEFFKIAYGINDISDPDELARVSKKIAEENAYSQGLLTTEVYEQYLSAETVGEQMSLLSQNPFEIFASLWSSSMFQFASTGKQTFFPIVGASAAAGAATGLMGGPFAQVTVPGGALIGVKKGFDIWSATTAYAMEAGGAYSTVMAREGIDMTDANAIGDVLSGKTKKYDDMLDEAFWLGVKRGVPIALMNIVSGKVVGKFVNPLASPLRQVGTHILAKTAVDPFFEGAGELSAQIFSGEGIQMTEVVNEMVGGQFGNHASIATNIISNTLLDNGKTTAKSLSDLNNMVEANHSINRVTAFVDRLRVANKKDSNKGITEEEGNKIIENAIANDAVNNKIKNSTNIPGRIKNALFGNTKVRQRLANLMSEQKLNDDVIKNKDFGTEISNEIDSILTKGSLPKSPIRLISDYRETIGKEMNAVNKVLKSLGIDNLQSINIDNIEEIENNPEAEAILTKMMEAENQDIIKQNKTNANKGLPQSPIYENVGEYITDVFSTATHSITPKAFGKQFSLYSGKSIMNQMINDRKNENLTGKKGFRHETLHFILDRVLGEEQVAKIAKSLEAYMEAESIKDTGGAISTGAWANIKKRLAGYRKKVESGDYTEADYNQEVFTTISDAINDDDLILERQNRPFWQKIADMLTDFFKYKLGISKEEINYQLLKTPEGAFEFLKNYNQSFIGGPQRYKKIKDVAGEGSGKSKQSLAGQVDAVNAIYDQYLNKEKTLDEVAFEIAMTPGYLGIVDDQGIKPDEFGNSTGMVNSIIKRKYNSLPADDQKDTIKNNFSDIRSALLYGDPRYGERNSVVGLVKEFTKEKHKYENVAAYINQFLSKRAIDVFTPIVSEAMGTELTAAKDVKVETKTRKETKDQADKPSLRKLLNIEDKSKFVKDIKAEVKKQLLMNVGKLNITELFKTLQTNFREYLTSPKGPIKSLLGTVASDKYKQFLKDNSEAVYDKISQSLMNKRFEDFIVPVIDPITGEQAVMDVFESRADVRVKSDTAGNLKFEKKKFDQQEFEDYHLKPKKGRPSSKQNTLVEVIAEEIGFDAVMEVLESKDVRESIGVMNPNLDTEMLITKVGREIERAPGMRFSESTTGTSISTQISDKVFTERTLNLVRDIERNDATEIFENGKLISTIADEYAAAPEVIKFVENLYNMGWITDAAGIRFMKNIAQNKNIDQETRDAFAKQEALKRTSEGLDVFANEMETVALALGPKIMDILKLDTLGFNSRVLDSAEKSGKNIDPETGEKLPAPFYEKRQEILKKLKDSKVKLPADILAILSDVRLMNKKYSLFKKIQTIQDLKTKKEKQEALSDPKLIKEIEDANAANIILANFIAQKIGELVIDGKISELSAINIAQIQTNIVGGFRALTRLVGYNIKNHSQAATETNPDYKIIYKIEQEKFVDRADKIEQAAKKIIGRKINKDDLMFEVPMVDFDSGKIIKGQTKAATKQEWIDWNAKQTALEFLGGKGEHMQDSSTTMADVANAWIVAKKISTESGRKEAISYLKNELSSIFDEYNQIYTNIYMTKIMDKIKGYGDLGSGANDPSKLKRIMYLKDHKKDFQGIKGQPIMEVVAEYEARKASRMRLSEMDNNPKTKKHNLKLIPTDLKQKENINSEVLNTLGTIDRALQIARDPNAPIKKIRVFDFDDTVARTKSNVLYTMPDGKEGKITAEEFARKGTKMEADGAKWDFSEFNKVVDGKKGPLFDVMKTMKDAKGNRDMFILTARSPEAAPAIQRFLKELGIDIPVENITGLADSSPNAKANWIVDKAAEGYNDFYFADDAKSNVKAVRDVLEQIDVKSKVQQAKMRFSEDVDRKINDIIESRTGIEWYKEFSPVKARTVGSSKGKFKFFVPPSADDFVGLLYHMLGKGKEGDAQMAFFKEKLLDPYARAMANVANDRISLIADFKALKKKLKNIPKNLRKEAIDGYTYEDVIRVYIWGQQGMDIPGLSKTDLKKITIFMSENPELQQFAEQLININKDDQYAQPGQSWLAGTITTDLINTLNTSKRVKYLQEWQDNIDLMFSEKNLNKLEAAFGANYREALENILHRMKTGSNRGARGGDRIANRFLDYVNNSVGIVMFFNMRSALLQTISAVNFINWSDNNMLAAGKAFANQPQFWKDFIYLMNSDFLVDRRNGLKINVSESEIADAAATSKNKAKGVIAYLLKKGFIPTQFADSFAIASGGATFYRNRVNKYLKQGMNQKEAEARAFNDFREIAEESQQSSRPDRISQQQAGGLGRIILAFANTPMQYTRLIKKATLDLANGRGDWKSNVSRIVYYGAIQNVIFNALQQAVFALAWGEDDEGDEDKEGLSAKEKKTYGIINGMLDSILRGTGIAGGILSVVKNISLEIYERSGRKRPEYADAAWRILDISPPIDIKVSKLKQAGNNWEYNQDLIESQGFSLDNPAWLSLGLVIAATTNVPLDRLIIKMNNVKFALASDEDMWKKISAILGYQEWQLRTEAEQEVYLKTRKEEKKAHKSLKKWEVIDGDEIEALTKKQQTNILKEIGLTDDEIKGLKYEADRVNRILEEYDKDKKKITKILDNKGKDKKLTEEEIEYNKIEDQTKAEQVKTLTEYGLTKKEIRDLKYEDDRIKKILELQED